MEIQQSTQFKIHTLSINLKDGEKSASFDIREIFGELNIYDTIFLSSISGNILINDSIGLLNKFVFDGSEIISIKIGKSLDDDVGDSSLVYEKKFRLYKITDRKNNNQTSESYLLHFISDEYIYSLMRKINRSYSGEYSTIARKIMKDKNGLGLVDEPVITPSLGIKNIIVPNLSPIESLEWMAKRAVNAEFLADYLFFENRLGYNFVSLLDIITQKPVCMINFNPKNLTPAVLNGKNSIGEEFLGARDFKVLTQFDFIETVKNGSWAGKFQGFDPVTRTLQSTDFGYSSFRGNTNKRNALTTLIQDKSGKLNSESYNTRKVLASFESNRNNSEYIKSKLTNTQENIVPDNPEQYLLQRRSIFKSFLDRKVRLVVPGNFRISSGLNVLLKTPDRSIRPVTGETDDRSLYASYTVISCRHMITFSKHETIFEAASDSTFLEEKPINVISTTNDFLNDNMA
jgi:hypothetical protein